MSYPGFTCITCRVAFNTADLQRFHYKSDWHRYNLKRKVVEMPPVTAEDFKQRVLAQQAHNAEAERDTSTFCKICGKHFNTENAYSNHLQSKKHKETEAKAKKRMESAVERENAKNREKGLGVNSDREDEDNRNKEESSAASSSQNSRRKKLLGATAQEDDDDDEEWEDVEDEPIPITNCLFCSHVSDSLEGNVDHMTVEHSFFIPHIDYLIDPEGLFEYLGEKVGSGLMCLWCNDKGKTFFSVEAAQMHMRDKGHCKIQYEGDAAYEYSDFYDFRSSYPDYEEGDTADDDNEDDGVEENEEDDDNDDNIEVAAAEQNSFELVLPSGARIGHRELMRYYKQNVPPTREVAIKNSQLSKKLRHYYKAIGWTGTMGEAHARQVKDLKVIQKFKEKQRLKVQTKANNLQKHFRPQVVF
ncbi:hypothetical protein HOLleu_34467 [Holothuria leucospilota]|uniref:Cytoplasmic 60S subunit biogenesis factor ZNF622 n=1 Tax=Holothuria leucospilota TaxID=206669 RepID=A0A9Q0YLG4_HOLLE|nr:hypothetical protein HOLleu_34467 [Holothuria leucospilota]